MRSARQFRVLMLGWEYPPRFVGGLGKACQGLSQAMAKLGAQVFFVLPSFPEKVSEKHLEVVGAQECMLEAGWELLPDRESSEDPRDQFDELKGQLQNPQQSPGSRVGTGEVIYTKTDVQLYPYGTSPRDVMSHSLSQMIERMGSGVIRPEVRKALKFTRVTHPIMNSERIQTKSGKDLYGENLWSEIERYCYTVSHLSETHEVDLVHAHDWMTFPAAFEFQRVTGVPVYLHVHATEYDRSGENLNQEVFRIEREGFRRANHIFAVSRYTAGIIERLYGVSSKKISVVYNAPEDGEKARLSRVTLGHPEQSRKSQVVFLGRLTFQKGPDHFLKAAALVSQANPEAQFILCGTGDMFEKLKQQAYRLGIEKRVHFAGFIDPAGVDEILMNSRVLVMPSVSEPFGLVALEAIRCGIPVILSKQSGVREVLPRALQVDFWDHEKLADQILAALRLKGLSKQLVEEGRGQLLQLSWEKSAQQVIRAYRKNLGSTYAQAIGGTHGH